MNIQEIINTWDEFVKKKKASAELKAEKARNKWPGERHIWFHYYEEPRFSDFIEYLKSNK